MNNKPFINHLILITAAVLFGCRGHVKQENQSNASAASVSMHAGNEKYFEIDKKQSFVIWKGSGPMGSHAGFVSISKGELMIDNDQLTGGAVEIDMNTIEDEGHRSDNNLIMHLKDADFFDVKKFPVSTIGISKVESINDEDKTITGNLTIRSITHPVRFPVKIKVNNGIVKADGKLVIDRTLWDVRYRSGKFFDNLKDQVISDSIEFKIQIVAKQNKDDLTKLSLPEAEIFKSMVAGTIYESSSPYHNVVHEFTHWVAMRDFCATTLKEMHANAETNEHLTKELERELLNAKTALTSPQFNGLKIEPGLYEVFLKQFKDQFKNKC